MIGKSGKVIVYQVHIPAAHITGASHAIFADIDFPRGVRNLVDIRHNAMIGLPIDDMIPGFIEICDHDIKHGYDSKYGGFYSQGPVAVFRALTDKVWWVQTEALNAMLTLYRLTGDDRYYKTYRDVFDFIENHHFAPDGGWWATLHPDGTPKTGLRASRWQGCYHTARSMVMCAHILDELAAEPGG